MSLLSSLTLSYETLADDPIEIGIHYGKSILGVLTASLQNSVQSKRLPAIEYTERKPYVKQRFQRRIDTPVQRQDYTQISFRTRPVVARSRQLQNRVMIGAL